ncbi:MAG TPA: pitrilysin family protein [Gammaproteobacteria bacterium]|nr:pitrilysin family protein [Gammaproteobacteria bacterium]
MKTLFTRTMALAGAALMGLLTSPPALQANENEVEIDIPYTKYVLDNGLTLIVHEDRKAPIVAVNVWYHVGSKDEKPGKTGFAHLFEHLMFNGSEHYNDDYLKPFDRVGATDMNGTTNFDRTNYFQNVPKTALDMALWMESDRMGHLLGAINQAKLDEQRGVVQNEKRQGENQPYGKAFLNIFENTYPEGHPYDHSVIGSMEDLNAASLEDVHEWFRTYYGAANAVIVVAGDVTAEEVKAKVEKYFGHIPAGPPLTKPRAWVAKRQGESRQIMQDRVPQARVYKVWNVPQIGDPDLDYLDLASKILAGGKSSRLYKRLVYTDQIATDVSAFVLQREMGSLFLVAATAQPGLDLAKVERALDEEMARFLKEGPTRDELERNKATQHASFVRGIERVGGFGGKSDVLAWSEVHLGSPSGWKTLFLRQQSASREAVRDAARRWLSDGVYVLEVHPYGNYKVAKAGVDRSQGVPVVSEFPQGDFPAHESATLANGLEVLLARRSAVPLVEFNLMLDAGYAADQFGRPGTADLALAMLDEGTKKRTALQIADELERLGAQLSADSDLDVSSVELSALKRYLDASLELYADVVLNPSFPESEFERLRKQQLAAIQREKVQPFSMALRVFPKLLYGEGHAYANPLTGSGTEESVRAMTLDELRAFHRTWFKPNNAKLVVVGDVTMAELMPLVEKHFGKWQPGEVPAKNLAPVPHRDRGAVYLIDRPGSEQSIIFAGHVVPPKNNPRELAILAMNEVLGGGFTARINMNLREAKHWSYGAGSLIPNAAGQRPFIVYAPVQTDKTDLSMAEIVKELTGITGSQPPTADELARVKDQETLSLPGRWETNDRVLADLSEAVRFGYPADYWDTYAARVRALGIEDVMQATREVIRPDRLVWVVVGDRSRIEAGIRKLGLGDIHYLDADGRPLAIGAN